ncbi:MAG: N-acetylglucosamine-6-phosphate deacetylase [Erysipelotrichaceae bacterium]|jgi:N-acetylglucosamine-6-phosphate deacetylase|nr:N-acetylglucosamine-6-phosphate deacetylase [Erysipelotrichaceae bacterium]
MKQRISGRLVLKDRIVEDELTIQDGIITHIGKNPDPHTTLWDLPGFLIYPGLIDVHLHGALGIDFASGNPADIETVGWDVARDGVTGFLASLTTLPHQELIAVLKRLSRVPEITGAARFLGVHAEGPYLSKEYKALMKEEYIHAPNTKELKEIAAAGKSLLKTMTFSPVYENTDELIRWGKKHGIRMMIGHTAANAKQVRAALDQGASGYTHFYNAMSPLHHRSDGTVSAGLSDSRGYVELIADGVHVSEAAVKICVKAVGADRLILVTDAMPGKSMPDGEFTFSYLDCIKEKGRAYVKASGRLAGSVISLNKEIKNIKDWCGFTDTELAKAASLNPARLLGIADRYGSLEVGKAGDLAVFDEDYNCQLTLVNGEVVYRRVML